MWCVLYISFAVVVAILLFVVRSCGVFPRGSTTPRCTQAQEGLAEIEEVVIEEGADGQGLQERVTRRFSGRFQRALPWQETVAAWAAEHVGQTWDEEVHPSELQELWRLSMPGTEAPTRKDPRWGMIGFQQQDPATDFRCGKRALKQPKEPEKRALLTAGISGAPACWRYGSSSLSLKPTPPPTARS